MIILSVVATVAGCARQVPGPFAWSGAVTPGSATVKVALPPDEAGGASLVLRRAGDAGAAPAVLAPSGTTSARSGDDPAFPRILTFDLRGLAPDTEYTYVPEVGGKPRPELSGRLRTFPPAGSPATFTVALGSCARTGSRHKVFTTIRDHRPLFFLHTGDLHYENIGRNDRDRFREAYGRVLASPTQSALYRNVPLAYVWDDHDYGPNNSDANSPARAAAQRVYREYVPHYPLAAGPGDAPIYHAFSAGRVRFVLTDLRSARAGQSLMGPAQKRWFLNELAGSARTHALVVWVSPVSWAGDPEQGKDRWSSYPAERREIADFVKAQGITGLVILSGDAHMLAIDDGTHTDFADGGGAGVPLFHAAALDEDGSVKTNRPFTHGPKPGGGQFGLMTVTDDGGRTVEVTWSGRNADDRELMSHRFRVPMDGR